MARAADIFAATIPCPKCHHPQSEVRDTVRREDRIWRRRRCMSCDHRFSTAERLALQKFEGTGMKPKRKHPMKKPYVMPDNLCYSDDDGYCEWKKCPQLRDREPDKTGRHCPLDDRSDGE